MSKVRADVLERREAKRKNAFMLETLWMTYDMVKEKLDDAGSESSDAVIAWLRALSSEDAEKIREAEEHCQRVDAEKRRLREKLSEVYQMMEPYLEEKRRRRFY